MLKNYIKTAFRNLQKNKVFSLVNILGLALGLTTCLLIIFYVTDELNFDNYNTKANRIYRVNANINFGGSASALAITPPPLAATLKSDFPEVENTVRLLHEVGVRIKKGNENIQEDRIVYADPSIFDIFTLPLISGNPKNALQEPNTAVITETTAKRYFNSTNVVGKTLLVNNKSNYKITGVLRDLPAQSHFNFDFFLSFSSSPESRNNNWFNYLENTYVLLKPDADYKTLEAKFPALIKKVTTANSPGFDYDAFEKSGNYFRMDLTPMKQIHLQSNRLYELGANGSMQYIYIFSAIAVFILLIACVNFMNLSTARSSNRAREVGVRKVLGSSRKQLMVQFLAESFLITLISAVVAVVAAWLLLPAFNQISGKELVVSMQTLIWLVPVITLIILVIGLLAGAYPAFVLSSFLPVDVLKGKVIAGFKGYGLRSFLVVFQFSISIFLICGTLVIYKQLQYIQNKNLGFNRDQVLIIKNVQVLGSHAKTLKQEVKTLPGVISASLTGYLPVTSNRNPDAVFTTKIANPKSALATEIWSVDEDYLSTTGMKLVMGRNFSKEMLTDSSGIIINETAAKMLGYTFNPLNKTLYQHWTGRVKDYRVIGVVKDFNFNSLRNNISPVVMVLGEDRGALSIRTSASNSAALVSSVEKKWKSLAPDQHFDYSFMSDDFDATYRSEQRIGKIFIVFTSIAILIACLGLFGLVTFMAEQRTKEIGIRKVLGASIGSIVSLLSKDFLKLVLLAIIIASPLAYFTMQKWLQDFAYRIQINWWVFALSGILAVMIALTTVSFQAIKAALANPVKSLKIE